jgi:hypothetical protein
VGTQIGKNPPMQIEVVIADMTTVRSEALVTAAFGFPLLQACQISVVTLLNASTQVEHCALIAFDIKTHKFWERILARTK